MVRLSPRRTKQESTGSSCSLGIYLPTGTGSRGTNSSSPSRSHFGVRGSPLQHAPTFPAAATKAKLFALFFRLVDGVLGPEHPAAGRRDPPPPGVYRGRGSPPRHRRGAGVTAEAPRSHLGTRANGPAVLKCFMAAQSSCAVLKAY